MDSSHLIPIAIIILCVLMSAYFSATETAYSSLSRVRIKNLAADGNRRAALVLRQSESYDKLISTILIGNNIVNILATSLATLLFIDVLGDTGATVSTIVMTIVILIFGEISPKSIAKDVPESFSMFSAPFLNILLKLLAPLNFLFTGWKKLLTSLFHIPASQGITEDELLTIVDEAQDDGGIDHEEGELIRSAIEFNDLDVTDVLTPRVDVEAIPENATNEEIMEVFRANSYSRLPVYRDNMDTIVGVIHEKDFYTRMLYGGEPLSAILQPPFFIPPSMQISRLLRELQTRQSHMAIVTDDFGGTVGIVTMEDVIEELVGEIWDEHDEVVSEIVPLSDTTCRVDCSTRLDKLFEYFQLDNVPEDISTVSGWILESFGYIPQPGEQFTYENLTVTVTETDGRRLLYATVESSPCQSEPA
jgi:putative hemolysin